MTGANGFTLPAECLVRAQRLIQRGGRKILGIAAAPGAGKSTLAEHLAAALGEQAQVVPMDGFHLSNAALVALDRRQRKGAPDTFDAEGYSQLLLRLRNQQPGQTIYAPEYLRTVEEGIAGSLAVQASTPLIITEGNYLLLQEDGWSPVRDLLDEVWYLDIDDVLREQRLLERHVQFGKGRQEAQDWIASTDAPNARRIALTAERADWRLQLDA